MKVIKSILLYLVTLLLSIQSYAAVRLELTRGVDDAYPIAIVPFANEQDHEPNISDIITQDLVYSGRFRALSNQQMLDSPHTAQEVKHEPWQKAGANAVVVGRVESIGRKQYRVSYALVNLYQAGKYADQVTLQKNFSVKSSDFRHLAHQIANEIYQKITGVRGIFTTKIAYVSVTGSGKNQRYELRVADYDGYNPQTILRTNGSIMSPAWSPDAKKIAYVSFKDRRSSIWVNDLVTGQRQLISRTPGINGAPAWSPNGNQLAMVLSKDGNPNIYIKHLKSNKLSQLTQGGAIDTEPTWSHDGKFIYFTSDRGGRPQIYRINVQSKKVNRVTFDGHYNARPSITADGQQLVTLHRGDAGTYSIAIENLATQQLQILSQGNYVQSPSIAPNGSLVVFSNKEAGDHYFLSVVSTDGKVQWNLPASLGNVREPAWSPFLKLR